MSFDRHAILRITAVVEAQEHDKLRHSVNMSAIDNIAYRARKRSMFFFYLKASNWLVEDTQPTNIKRKLFSWLCETTLLAASGAQPPN